MLQKKEEILSFIHKKDNILTLQLGLQCGKVIIHLIMSLQTKRPLTM